MNNKDIVPDEILHQRALLYAEDHREKINNPLDHLLVFSLEDQWFGVSTKVLHRIENFGEVLFIPKVNPTLLGLVNIQGRFLPLIDLRQLLHLPKLQTIDKQLCRFVIIEPFVVFIADRIAGVTPVFSSNIIFQEISHENNLFIRCIVEVSFQDTTYQVGWLKDTACDNVL